MFADATNMTEDDIITMMGLGHAIPLLTVSLIPPEGVQVEEIDNWHPNQLTI